MEGHHAQNGKHKCYTVSYTQANIIVPELCEFRWQLLWADNFKFANYSWFIARNFCACPHSNNTYL